MSTAGQRPESCDHKKYLSKEGTPDMRKSLSLSLFTLIVLTAFAFFPVNAANVVWVNEDMSPPG